MVDCVPPRLGDVYSGVTPPKPGEITQLSTRDYFLPGVDIISARVQGPSSPRDDILSGDNPNSTVPPLGSESPDGQFEMPPIREPLAPDQPYGVEQDVSLKQLTTINDSPPKGGNYGEDPQVL